MHLPVTLISKKPLKLADFATKKPQPFLALGDCGRIEKEVKITN